MTVYVSQIVVIFKNIMGNVFIIIILLISLLICRSFPPCVVTTMATETQSDADHYAPCTEFYQEHYCKNGGTCQYIIALGKNTCE